MQSDNELNGEYENEDVNGWHVMRKQSGVGGEPHALHMERAHVIYYDSGGMMPNTYYICYAMLYKM